MRARFARGMTAAFMVAGCAAGNSASTATFEELRTSYQLGDEQLVATAPLPFAATQVRFGYENGVIEASFATSEGPERAIEFFKMLSPEFLRQVQRQTRAALDAATSQDAKGFYTVQKTAAHLFQPAGESDPVLYPWYDESHCWDIYWRWYTCVSCQGGWSKICGDEVACAFCWCEYTGLHDSYWVYSGCFDGCDTLPCP